MKIVLIIISLMCAISVEAGILPYKTPLAFLATRYRAFHTCNCLYVMKMNQQYCENFSKVDPPMFTLVVDAANKSVSSGISGIDFKPAVAKFANDRTGCHIVNN